MVVIRGLFSLICGACHRREHFQAFQCDPICTIPRFLQHRGILSFFVIFIPLESEHSKTCVVLDWTDWSLASDVGSRSAFAFVGNVALAKVMKTSQRLGAGIKDGLYFFKVFSLNAMHSSTC